MSEIMRRILPVSAVLACLVGTACHESAARVDDAGDDATGVDAGDAAQTMHDGEAPVENDAGQEADAGNARDAGNDADGASSSDAGSDAAVAPNFTDSFDTFDQSRWSCEYTCPTSVDGKVVFALQASVPPDQEGSWSKIRYKPQRFTSGKFTVRFALSARPTEAVWWGVALWDDGPSDSEFNELNFGYTTDESFPNTQMRFESARRGNAVSRKVDTGVDLYDGSYHTATLEYDATHVALYFDGKLLDTITDTSVIPTDPVDYLIGPRLVTGSDALQATFSESIDSTEIWW